MAGRIIPSPFEKTSEIRSGARERSGGILVWYTQKYDIRILIRFFNRVHSKQKRHVRREVYLPEHGASLGAHHFLISTNLIFKKPPRNLYGCLIFYMLTDWWCVINGYIMGNELLRVYFLVCDNREIIWGQFLICFKSFNISYVKNLNFKDTQT